MAVAIYFTFYLGSEDEKFQHRKVIFRNPKAASSTLACGFWHIWLAGLLAYFRFDIARRQLQSVNQIIDHAITMKWPLGQPQPFGTFWYSWIIDRLDINLMFVEQKLANPRAVVGVVDHYRHDMRIPLKHRQIGGA